MGFALGSLNGASEPFPAIAGGYMNTTLIANCFVRGVDSIAAVGGGDVTWEVTLLEALSAQDLIIHAQAAQAGIYVDAVVQSPGVLRFTPSLISNQTNVAGAPFWWSVRRILP